MGGAQVRWAAQRLGQVVAEALPVLLVGQPVWRGKLAGQELGAGQVRRLLVGLQLAALVGLVLVVGQLVGQLVLAAGAALPLVHQLPVLGQMALPAGRLLLFGRSGWLAVLLPAQPVVEQRCEQDWLLGGQLCWRWEWWGL